MTEAPQQGLARPCFDVSGPHEVRFSDVEYARRGDDPLLARVYRPVAAGPWPALVDVHGGAWAHFDRTADAYFDRALAACGMVVVALDFRQGGAHPFPASVRDVLSGVRFVRRQAAELDALADAIGLVGGSSGGHLCLLAAICPEEGEFKEDGGQQRGDASVAYAMPLWPIADPAARYRYLEPFLAGVPPSPSDPFFDPARLRAAQEAHFGDEATMVRASIPRILRAGEFQQLPPIWVAHPANDRNVTLAMSEDLVAAYRAAGGDATLEVFADVGHAFANFPGEDADRCIERMRAFIAERLTAPGLG
jgi:acetyl esterase/lipase